jgi:hypothetical protein
MADKDYMDGSLPKDYILNQDMLKQEEVICHIRLETK